jgi:hypothetical protein
MGAHGVCFLFLSAARSISIALMMMMQVQARVARIARLPGIRVSHRFLSAASNSPQQTIAAAASPATPAAATTTTASASSGATSAAADASVPTFSTASTSTSTSRSPTIGFTRSDFARKKVGSTSSGVPTGSHFWKAGVPFLLFLTVAAMGTASMLQPKIDARDGSMAQRLYGEMIESDENNSQLISVDPNKKKSNVPLFGQSTNATNNASPKKLTSLAEEYAKASKDFETDYVNKRVPRLPGDNSYGHGK